MQIPPYLSDGRLILVQHSEAVFFYRRCVVELLQRLYPDLLGELKANQAYFHMHKV
jgi:hypothetical protein